MGNVIYIYITGIPKIYLLYLYILIFLAKEVTIYGVSTKVNNYGTYISDIDETCLIKKCTQNEAFSIWATQRIMVKRIITNGSRLLWCYNCIDNPKFENNVNTLSPSEEYIDLFLPPPIITVWLYEIAFALSEG
jgi:hypothetical protein